MDESSRRCNCAPLACDEDEEDEDEEDSADMESADDEEGMSEEADGDGERDFAYTGADARSLVVSGSDEDDADW